MRFMDFEYSCEDSEICIEKYLGSDTVVNIPKRIENLPVTEIGQCAFEHCDSLISVTIPDSVTEIGSWAFSDCSSLTSVTIPDSVRKIGSGAFKGCTSLKTISIPKHLEGSFAGLDSKTKIIKKN